MKPSSRLTPLQSPSSLDPPLHPHSPLPTHSDSCPSTPPLDSPQTEPLLLKLSEHTHMKFQSPLPQSLGMKTARAWHQEHLALVRQRFDEKNRRRIAAGHIPVRHPYLTTHTAPSAPDQENTATAIPPLRTQHSPSQHPQHPYLSQLQPFRPTEWRHLTSIVRKPRRWQLDSPLHSNKTVKIPLKYRHHTQSKPKLPKGWVYVDEEVEAGVKEEVTDPCKYTVLPQRSPDQSSLDVQWTAPTSAQATCTLPAKLGRKGLKRTLDEDTYPLHPRSQWRRNPGALHQGPHDGQPLRGGPHVSIHRGISW
jgi:hypothetical protein